MELMDDEQQPKRGRRARKYEVPEDLDRYAGNNESAARIFDDGLVEYPEDLEEPPCPEDLDPKAWASERLPERLTYIRNLLSRGMYDYGKHPQVIADKWGISVTRVKEICSEAERQLALLQGTSNERASEFFAERLLRISADAHRDKSYMAAISGVAKAAELTVAPKTMKVDVSVAYSGMTPSELEAEYRKELAAAAKLGLLKGKDIPDAEFEETGDRATPVMPEGTGDE